MKMAPIIKKLEKNGNSIFVVHTEQHYDSSMSGKILRSRIESLIIDGSNERNSCRADS